MSTFKELAEQLQKPVIVEDTGLYFKAYNNFSWRFYLKFGFSRNRL